MKESLRQFARRTALLLVAALLASPSVRADEAPAANPHAKDPAFEERGYYIIQPGDTCLDVAKKVWPDDPGGLDRLHELNDMGPLPHNLVPGMKLRIVSNVPDATVTFLKPDVNVRKAGRPDWESSRIGDGLFNLDQLSTLTGAAAALLFRDRSTLQLDQNALITVYESALNTKKKQRSGAIELVQGDLRVHLAELRGDKGAINVKTPGAQVSAEGATMSVGVDDKKMSRVSVFDGTAAVAAAGETVDVKHGFGTRVAEGTKPEAPQPLPPTPVWALGGAQDVGLAAPIPQKDGKYRTEATLQFRWAEVTTAVRYRLEMALDGQFNSRLIDRYIDAKDPREFNAPAGVGTYFARVSAYNAAGLVSRPSETKQIDVKKLEILQGSLSAKEPGMIKGSVEIRIKLPDRVRAKVLLDGYLDDDRPIVIRGTSEHKLEIDIGGQQFKYVCTVAPPRAIVTFSPDLKYAIVRFIDATNHPVAFKHGPDVKLGVNGLEGTRVHELDPVGDGFEWHVPIEPHSVAGNGLAAEVLITWEGRTIGQGHKEIALQQ